MNILKLPVDTRINCECGCKFDFDTDDLNVVEAYCDDHIVRIISVYCPFCKKEHILQKPKI